MLTIFSVPDYATSFLLLRRTALVIFQHLVTLTYILSNVGVALVIERNRFIVCPNINNLLNFFRLQTFKLF